MKNKCKLLIMILLATVMALTQLSVAAFAEDEEEEPVPQYDVTFSYEDGGTEVTYCKEQNQKVRFTTILNDLEITERSGGVELISIDPAVNYEVDPPIGVVDVFRDSENNKLYAKALNEGEATVVLAIKANKSSDPVDYTIKVSVAEHEHVWKTQKVDDGRKVWCDTEGCRYHTPTTLSLTAEDLPYTGEPYEGATWEKSEEPKDVEDVFDCDIYYEGVTSAGMEYESSMTAPTDCGIYKATLKINREGKKPYKALEDTFEIIPIPVIAPYENPDLEPYTGKPQVLFKNAQRYADDPEIGFVYCATTEPVEPDSDQYKTYGKCNGKQIDAGTYYIWYKVYVKLSEGSLQEVSTDNFVLVDEEGEVVGLGSKYITATIDKADPFDELPEGLILRGTGSAQELVAPGTTKDDDQIMLLYSFYIDSNWSQDVPTAADVKAYHVYYRYKALTDNYKDYPEDYSETGIPASVVSVIYDSSQEPPVLNDDLVYEGTDQELIDEPAVISDKLKELGAKKVYYAVTTEYEKPTSGWKSEKNIDKITGHDAGTYYVWYAIVDADKNPVVETACVPATIAQKELTITPEDLTVEYGTEKEAALAAVQLDYDGLVEGETIPAPTISTDYETGDDVGEYTISLSYDEEVLEDIINYDIRLVDGTLKVEPKKVYYHWNTRSDCSYVYDGTVQRVNRACGIKWKDIEGVDEHVVDNTATDAGTYTAEVSLVGPKAGNYQIVQGSTYEWSIAQKEVTFKWANSDDEKVFELPYTGRPQSIHATIEGVLDADKDDVEVVYGTNEESGKPNNTHKNAGEYTATVDSLDGDRAGNYTFAAATEEETTAKQDFEITKKALTITANDNTITYGDEAANDGYSCDGLVGADQKPNTHGKQAKSGVLDETDIAWAYGEYAVGSDAGTYEIMVSGITAQNYEITFAPGTLTVEPKEVTFDWFNSDDEKVFELPYTGKPQSIHANIEGVLDADKDDVEVVYGTDEESGKPNNTHKNAGEYTATVDALDGDKAGNYTFVAATDEGTTAKQDFEITKKDLTITANDNTITYGDEAANDGYSCEGLVGADQKPHTDGKQAKSGVLDETDIAWAYGEYAVGSDAGTYEIMVSGITAQNYEITYAPGTLTVDPRELTMYWVTDGHAQCVANGQDHYVKAVLDGFVEGEEVLPKYGEDSVHVSKVAGTFVAKVVGLLDKMKDSQSTEVLYKASNYKLVDDNGDEITVDNPAKREWEVKSPTPGPSPSPSPESNVDKVIRLIKALPDPDKITTDDKAKVDEAKAAYDALTDAEKARIPADLVTKLNNCVAAEQAAQDKKAADDVIALINALPAPDQITEKDKDAVDKAQKAYEALTDDQKKLVPADITKKLTDCVAAEEAAEKKEEDQKAADAVDALIIIIPDDFSQASPDDVKAARAAYDALTDAQKALVDPQAYKKLESAEYYFAKKDAKARKAKLKSVKARKGKKAVAKWRKETAANGYQLVYSTNKKFKKGNKKVTIKSYKTVKKVVKKLKAKKRYYFRIRTYNYVYNPGTGEKEKTYGKWSNKKSIKAKK